MSDDFVARYYQYHRLYEMPVPTIDRAIYLFAAGVDNGRLVPEDVTRQDGTVVLDHEETLKRVEATIDEWDAEANK